MSLIKFFCHATNDNINKISQQLINQGYMVFVEEVDNVEYSYNIFIGNKEEILNENVNSKIEKYKLENDELLERKIKGI